MAGEQPREGNGRYGEKIEVGVQRRLTEALRTALGHDGTPGVPGDDVDTRIAGQNDLAVLIASNEPIPVALKVEDCEHLEGVAAVLGVDEAKAAELIVTAKVPGVSMDVIAEALDWLADETKRVFTAKQRQRAAEEGAALPDGSFPIRNASDLANAIQALGRAKDPDRARKHIIKRARALGLVAKLPESWNVKSAADEDDEEKRIGFRSRPKFQESQHPRDAHGRFATVGSTVRLPGGGSGKITSNAGGGRVNVQRADGSTQTVNAKDVTVTQGPAAGRVGKFASTAKPAKAPAAVPAAAPAPAPEAPAAKPSKRQLPAPAKPGQGRTATELRDVGGAEHAADDALKDPVPDAPLSPEQIQTMKDDLHAMDLGIVARGQKVSEAGGSMADDAKVNAYRRRSAEIMTRLDQEGALGEVPPVQAATRIGNTPAEAAANAKEAQANAARLAKEGRAAAATQESNIAAREGARAKALGAATDPLDRKAIQHEQDSRRLNTLAVRADQAGNAEQAKKFQQQSLAERAKAKAARAELAAKTGPLDDRLVNYKPERDLADPSKTQDLAEMLPNARMVPYSKTPFIDAMHRMMGVNDPLTHDMGDYLRRRDALFNQQPLTDVPLDNVAVTQARVRGERVQQIRDHPETGGTKPQHFVRHNGTTYVMNGHHRVAAQILDGDPSTTGRLLNLDEGSAITRDDGINRNTWGGRIPPNLADGEGTRKKDGKPFGVGYPDSDPRTDPSYDQYVEALDVKIAEKMASLGDTETRFDKINGVSKAYQPERVAVHDQILDRLMAKYANIPKDGKAIVMAGPPGAGKSTVIKKSGHEFGVETDENGDPTNYAVVNPDDMKEELLHAGAVPDDYIDTGIAPAETATFTHEESSHLAEQLLDRLKAEGHNVILDGTFAGKPEKQVGKVHGLREDGYYVSGVLVDGSVDKSLQNAGSRHRRKPSTPGGPYQGRYVPIDLIQSNAPHGDTGDSKVFGRPHKNRSSENIERVQDAFDGGVFWYDNSTGASKQVKSTKPGEETAALRQMDALDRRITAVKDPKKQAQLRAQLESLRQAFDFHFDSIDEAWARQGIELEEKVAQAEDDEAKTDGGGADRNRGGAEKLRRYWTHGEGAAKIRWGTPGDHSRCVSQLVEHGKFTTAQAHGYCNLREKEATGRYPAQHAAAEKHKAITWLEGLVELKADLPNVNPQPSGVMVALYPPDDVAQALAVDGGVPAEGMHVTLAYLGDVSEVGDRVADLVDVVSAFSNDSYDLSGEVSGLGRFSNVDDDGQQTMDAFYASVDTPELPDFRVDVVDALEAAGFDVRRDHGFTPHLTLAYIDPGADLPMARIEPIPCVFGTLSLAYGEDVYDFPLHPSDTAVNPSGSTSGGASPQQGEGNAPYDQAKTP